MIESHPCYARDLGHTPPDLVAEADASDDPPDELLPLLRLLVDLVLDEGCGDAKVLGALDIALLQVARSGGKQDMGQEVAAFVRDARILDVLQLAACPSAALSLLSLGLRSNAVAASLHAGSHSLLQCALLGSPRDPTALAALGLLSACFTHHFLTVRNDASTCLMCCFLRSPAFARLLLEAAHSSLDAEARARFVMALAFWVGVRQAGHRAPPDFRTGHQHDALALEHSLLLRRERRALLALRQDDGPHTRRQEALRRSHEADREWTASALDLLTPALTQCLFDLCLSHPADLELHYMVYRLVGEVLDLRQREGVDLVGPTGVATVEGQLAACNSQAAGMVCYEGIRMLLVAQYRCREAMVGLRFLHKVEHLLRRVGGVLPNALMGWAVTLLAMYSTMAAPELTRVRSLCVSLHKVVVCGIGFEPCIMFLIPVAVALIYWRACPSRNRHVHAMELVAVLLLHPLLAVCAHRRFNSLLSVLRHMHIAGLSHLAATPPCLEAILTRVRGGDEQQGTDLLRRLCSGALPGGGIWRTCVHTSLARRQLIPVVCRVDDAVPLTWEALAARCPPPGCRRQGCSNLRGASEDALWLRECWYCGNLQFCSELCRSSAGHYVVCTRKRKRSP